MSTLNKVQSLYFGASSIFSINLDLYKVVCRFDTIKGITNNRQGFICLFILKATLFTVYCQFKSSCVVFIWCICTLFNKHKTQFKVQPSIFICSSVYTIDWNKYWTRHLSKAAIIIRQKAAIKVKLSQCMIKADIFLTL